MKPSLKALVRLSLLLISAPVAGCFAPIESTTPLSGPGETYDQRLVGAWTSVVDADSGAFYLQIMPGEKPETLDVIGIAIFPHRADQTVFWLSATAYASRIGSKTYFNAQREIGSGFDYTAIGERPGFIILEVSLLDDATLSLCPMNEDGLTGKNPSAHLREVPGKFVGGEVGGGDTYKVLDISRDDLLALVRDVPPEKLFQCFPLFHKVTITNRARFWPPP